MKATALLTCLLSIFLFVRPLDAAEAESPDPKWRSEILGHPDAFRLLFKPGTTGNNVSEIGGWNPGEPLEGRDERMASLEKVLEHHGDSPFADDAALLLARARFVYDGDVDTAIRGLREVIEKHPDRTFIAEDPVVLSDIAVLMFSYGPQRSARLFHIPPGAPPSAFAETLAYMDHRWAHPNSTADVARNTIAWIIVRGRVEERYPEAEKALREVIERHRGGGRTQLDLEAACEHDAPLIAKMSRPEQEAHWMLIDLLRRQGRHDEAIAEAQEYMRLHKGHSTAARVLRHARGQ